MIIQLSNSRVEMLHALQEAGNDVELVTVPGQGHGFFDGEEYYQRIYAFLERVLAFSV